MCVSRLKLHKTYETTKRWLNTWCLLVQYNKRLSSICVINFQSIAYNKIIKEKN